MTELLCYDLPNIPASGREAFDIHCTSNGRAEETGLAASVTTQPQRPPELEGDPGATHCGVPISTVHISSVDAVDSGSSVDTGYEIVVPKEEAAAAAAAANIADASSAPATQIAAGISAAVPGITRR